MNKKEVISIISHTVVELACIIAIVLFVGWDKLDVKYALGAIGLIAGIWGKGFQSMKQPPSGLAVGLAVAAFNLLKGIRI